MEDTDCDAPVLLLLLSFSSHVGLPRLESPASNFNCAMSHPPWECHPRDTIALVTPNCPYLAEVHALVLDAEGCHDTEDVGALALQVAIARLEVETRTAMPIHCSLQIQSLMCAVRNPTCKL